MIESSWVLSAAFGGVVTGLWAPKMFVTTAGHVAHIFKNMLELLSLPVIFLSIVSAFTGMTSKKDVAHVGLRTFFYTILTTIIAALTGLLCFVLIKPTNSASVLSSGAEVAGALQHKYLDFLLGIVPSNIIQSFGPGGNVISLVFLATVMGLAILNLPEKQRSLLHDGFSALFAMMLSVAKMVLYFLPAGIWAFVVLFIQSVRDGQASLLSVGLYTATILLANVIQAVVVLPLFLSFKGFAPYKVWEQFRAALTVAFFSKSSSMALPVTLRCAKENAGVKEKVAQFVLPLCATINMNGCAAFILITLLFVAGSSGIALPFVDMLVWAFIAVVAAIGNAGVPMGCFFLTSAFLAHMQLPLNLLGVILPIYGFLDMVETSLNVWSDACVTVVVDKEV